MLGELRADKIGEASRSPKAIVVEAELSLPFDGPLTNGVAQACTELKIPVVANVMSSSKQCFA